MKTVLPQLTFLLGVVIWTLSGCSYTYPVSFGADKARGDTVTVGTFNRRLVNRDVSILTRDGREISASEVFLSRDSCSFIDSTGGRAFLPTADICTVRHVDRLSSTVGGFMLGTLAGFAVATGGALAIIRPDDSDSRTTAAYFAVGAIVAGSAVGITVGAIHGTINDYIIPQASPDSTGDRTLERSPLDSLHGGIGSGVNGS